jgi:hypothetical protein
MEKRLSGWKRELLRARGENIPNAQVRLSVLELRLLTGMLWRE